MKSLHRGHFIPVPDRAGHREEIRTSLHQRAAGADWYVAHLVDNRDDESTTDTIDGILR